MDHASKAWRMNSNNTDQKWSYSWDTLHTFQRHQWDNDSVSQEHISCGWQKIAHIGSSRNPLSTSIGHGNGQGPYALGYHLSTEIIAPTCCSWRAGREMVTILLLAKNLDLIMACVTGTPLVSRICTKRGKPDYYVFTTISCGHHTLWICEHFMRLLRGQLFSSERRGCWCSCVVRCRHLQLQPSHFPARICCPMFITLLAHKRSSELRPLNDFADQQFYVNKQPCWLWSCLCCRSIRRT